MYEEIIIAGFGGQGVLLAGKMLAQAAMNSDKKVTWMPSYGAEVRGGTAHSMVVVSDKEIPSPVINNPTTCIAMNEPSAAKFVRKLKPGGLLLLNKSLVRRVPKRKDIRIIGLPLNEIAEKIGNIKVANMVALGAYVRLKRTVPVDKLIDALKSTIPAHRRNLLQVNKKALYKGAELVRNARNIAH